MARNILITGCSGGGKSTLVTALEAMGFAVVHEPGLRVIRGGGPKPWENLAQFVEAAIKLARGDLARAEKTTGPIFFDRGLFDALSGKAARDKIDITQLLPTGFPYAEPVIFAPPWPEIFENTAERQLSFEQGEQEAIRLERDLDLLNIATFELPKCPVEERVELVLQRFDLA